MFEFALKNAIMSDDDGHRQTSCSFLQLHARSTVAHKDTTIPAHAISPAVPACQHATGLLALLHSTPLHPPPPPTDTHTQPFILKPPTCEVEDIQTHTHAHIHTTTHRLSGMCVCTLSNLRMCYLPQRQQTQVLDPKKGTLLLGHVHPTALK